MKSHKINDDIQTGKCQCCHKVNPDTTQFKVAVAKAKLLRKRMKMGLKWTIRVHHNIYWYYSLHTLEGRLQIYPSYDQVRYHTLFTPNKGDGGGDPVFLTHSGHKNPNDAVDKQLEIVRRVLRTRIANDNRILELITEEPPF